MIALKEPCDIVIASSGPITVGLPALIAKWFRRKKMVFEIRDLWPQGAIELGKIKNKLLIKMAYKFEKLCYSNSELVVACSQGMADSVNYRFPNNETLVIPNASDIELFRNKIIPPSNICDENKKLFVYAGSLGLMDHGHLMIEAMRLMPITDIKLIIIGDGADKQELENKVLKYQLSNVEFLGLISKNEVVSWLNSAVASLILFKNYQVLQTSSPNKLFDAFAAGIPVIHNTTGWMKKLTDDSNCGISIQPDDSQQLCDAMMKLANDVDLRNKMSVNSAKLAETQFNRDIVSENYLNALKKL